MQNFIIIGIYRHPYGANNRQTRDSGQVFTCGAPPRQISPISTEVRSLSPPKKLKIYAIAEHKCPTEAYPLHGFYEIFRVYGSTMVGQLQNMGFTQWVSGLRRFYPEVHFPHIFSAHYSGETIRRVRIRFGGTKWYVRRPVLP